MGAVSSVSKAREGMYDSVHMKPAGYSLLASKIKEMTKAWLLIKMRTCEGREALDSGHRGGIGGKGEAGSSKKER
jgi:hypothetical protein